MHLFMCSVQTHTAGLCKSAYRGNVLAGLTVVGACVADTAFTVCSVKHPGPQLCVCMCVYLSCGTELTRWKAPSPSVCLNTARLGFSSAQLLSVFPQY